MRDSSAYKKLKAAGIPVHSLGKKSWEPRVFTDEDLEKVQNLINAVDVVMVLKEQPLDLLVRLDLKGKKIIVCLHRTDPAGQGESSIVNLRYLKAKYPQLELVCCAESSKIAYATELQVEPSEIQVITNGVNIRQFAPSDTLRQQTRLQLGIPSSAPVVCMAARFDEMKNIPLCIEAVSVLFRSNLSANIILCGAGMSSDNIGLMELIIKNIDESYKGRLHLLGIQSKMTAIYNASDIVALTSSYGEAYPLCLIEGMCVGAIPVATDVGDTKNIVSSSGYITENTPQSVAGGWAHALEYRIDLRQAVLARRREFSERHMLRAYARLIRRSFDSLDAEGTWKLPRLVAVSLEIGPSIEI